MILHVRKGKLTSTFLLTFFVFSSSERDENLRLEKIKTLAQEEMCTENAWKNINLKNRKTLIDWMLDVSMNRR